MEVPNFDRAEYVEPQVIEGVVVGQPLSRRAPATFPLALLYGAIAAILGSIGYALVASLGFMISIVAIGIAWLIAKAMMTASRGIGNRSYQIAAVLLTYFAVSFGELLPLLWRAHQQHGASLAILLNPVVLKYVLFGPFLELQQGLNAIIGIVIIGIGMRTAWRMAAGSPGFGQTGTGGRRITPFG